jgi:hypothetical protein
MRFVQPVAPLLLAAVLAAIPAEAATYFVNPQQGDDAGPGTSAGRPWRSLERAGRAQLQPGDRLLLLAGVRHTGGLSLSGLTGTAAEPIRIGSYSPGGDKDARAQIDGRGRPAAVALRNCSYVQVSDLVLTADGGPPAGAMRCGALIEADAAGEHRGIALLRLHVKSVSHHPPGFRRPAADVRTPNGNLPYGWGIRFIVAPSGGARMSRLIVRDCRIERVDHTGLKFTAPTGGIRDIEVSDLVVSHTGGPGVQMSGVTGARFSHLSVDHSGSTGDPRNWGRGSGLWAWGTNDVIIERSRFTNAHGPGDSAGVHIDFGCRDVVVQYNVSANNAGGFCEILGDNHNCAYRYNISIDDGHRVKGRDGAFQEGKIFWLSGYVGEKRKPSGPFNSYFYNNTVYVREGIAAKFAIAPSATGVLVANNIFCIAGAGEKVAGDQDKAERAALQPVARAWVANNLFLRADNWPSDLGLADPAPLLGDPGFARPGGDRAADYLPGNAALVRDRGVFLEPLPGDKVGLKPGLRVEADILGRPIVGPPDLGAIELP